MRTGADTETRAVAETRTGTKIGTGTGTRTGLGGVEPKNARSRTRDVDAMRETVSGKGGKR